MYVCVVLELAFVEGVWFGRLVNEVVGVLFFFFSSNNKHNMILAKYSLGKITCVIGCYEVGCMESH